MTFSISEKTHKFVAPIYSYICSLSLSFLCFCSKTDINAWHDCQHRQVPRRNKNKNRWRLLQAVLLVDVWPTNLLFCSKWRVYQVKQIFINFLKCKTLYTKQLLYSFPLCTPSLQYWINILSKSLNTVSSKKLFALDLPHENHMMVSYHQILQLLQNGTIIVLFLTDVRWRQSTYCVIVPKKKLKRDIYSRIIKFARPVHWNTVSLAAVIMLINHMLLWDAWACCSRRHIQDQMHYLTEVGRPTHYNTKTLLSANSTHQSSILRLLHSFGPGFGSTTLRHITFRAFRAPMLVKVDVTKKARGWLHSPPALVPRLVTEECINKMCIKSIATSTSSHRQKKRRLALCNVVWKWK